MESENTSPPSEVFPRISCRESHVRLRSEEVAEVSPGISCDSRISIVTPNAHSTNLNSIAIQHRAAFQTLQLEVTGGSDLTTNNIDAVAKLVYEGHELDLMIENSVGHFLYEREDFGLAQAFHEEVEASGDFTIKALEEDAMPLTAICRYEAASVFTAAFESALESLADTYREHLNENRADALSHA